MHYHLYSFFYVSTLKVVEFLLFYYEILSFFSNPLDTILRLTISGSGFLIIKKSSIFEMFTFYFQWRCTLVNTFYCNREWVRKRNGFSFFLLFSLSLCTCVFMFTHERTVTHTRIELPEWQLGHRDLSPA